MSLPPINETLRTALTIIDDAERGILDELADEKSAQNKVEQRKRRKNILFGLGGGAVLAAGLITLGIIGSDVSHETPGATAQALAADAQRDPAPIHAFIRTYITPPQSDDGELLSGVNASDCLVDTPYNPTHGATPIYNTARPDMIDIVPGPGHESRVLHFSGVIDFETLLFPVDIQTADTLYALGCLSASGPTESK